MENITAIKVLFIPAFNYLFITLPNPDQEIANHINSILFNFLWSYNVKIKRNVVIKQYWEGGLKMVNFAAFIEALKLTWIRRLLRSDSKWQDFIKFFIKSDKLVGCSIEYIKKELKNIKNPFWLDVFQSLINYNEKTCC